MPGMRVEADRAVTERLCRGRGCAVRRPSSARNVRALRRTGALRELGFTSWGGLRRLVMLVVVMMVARASAGGSWHRRHPDCRQDQCN